jgi:hypothetical protein
VRRFAPDVVRTDETRSAFQLQADWCDRLGSSFTANLCRALAATLDATTPLGARVLGWPGDAQADALALRLCGGLHALVRSGEAPELARLYPPAPMPSVEELAKVLALTLATRGAALDPWLDGAPQTNEVGRSALLFAGLMTVSARFGLPLRLYELGASSGLNLQLDLYVYRLGGVTAGAAQSTLRLDPDWRGPPPPDADVRIVGREGVDLDPIYPVTGRERLLAYVWPDQPERLARTAAALDIAAADPPPVARGDAGAWIEARLPVESEPGVCRVLIHSVAFQYFPPDTQARVAARLEQAGAQANERAPLAWLRLEKLPEDEEFSLRLRCWPGEETLLAWSHPHGAWVEWLGRQPASTEV